MTWLAVLAALATTIVVCPVAGSVLRRYGRTDLPFHGSAGDRPGIRGGGIALFVGCAVATALAPHAEQGGLARLLLVAVVVGLIGIADDIREIGHGPKFLYELVVLGAGSAYLLSINPPLSLRSWLIDFGVMLLAVNAFNFMDGINGVSVLVAAVVGIAYAILGAVYHFPLLELGALVVVAVSAGFLPFNFPRARLFMGDAGTYFLGAWGSGLTVLGIHHGIPAVALFLPALPYAADTGTTLFRRIRRKAAWTHSHREHVYHQLVTLGWTHTRTTLTIVLLTVFCSAAGLWAAQQSFAVQLGTTAVCLAPAAVYAYLPTFLRRRQALRATVAAPALSRR